MISIDLDAHRVREWVLFVCGAVFGTAILTALVLTPHHIGRLWKGANGCVTSHFRDPVTGRWQAVGEPSWCPDAIAGPATQPAQSDTAGLQLDDTGPVTQ